MMAPRLPAGRERTARSKAGQSIPYSLATRSRASEPLRQQITAICPPVGAPATCPVSEGSGSAELRSAISVSLVPSEMATRPGSMMPVPISVHGLSPEKATTSLALKP